MTSEYSEARDFWSVDPAEPVKIRMGTEGLAAEKPLAIPECFQRIVDNHPDHPALAYQDEVSKEWKTVSYA